MGGTAPSYLTWPRVALPSTLSQSSWPHFHDALAQVHKTAFFPQKNKLVQNSRKRLLMLGRWELVLAGGWG